MMAASRASPVSPGGPRCRRLMRGAANLQATNTPRRLRRDVVDDEGDLRVDGDVPVLLALGHVVTEDVDGAQFGVEGEPDRAGLGRAVPLDGGQPAQVSAIHVVDFVRFESHASTVGPQLSLRSSCGRRSVCADVQHLGGLPVFTGLRQFALIGRVPAHSRHQCLRPAARCAPPGMRFEENDIGGCGRRGHRHHHLVRIWRRSRMFTSIVPGEPERDRQCYP